MTNNPNPMVLDPEAIWLEPQCAEYGDGRTWANPAPEVSCDDCGLPWVKYVRADLALSTSTTPATEEAARLIDALSRAFALLDSAADEGYHHVYGNGQTLDATDVVTELASALGIEPEPGWERQAADMLAAFASQEKGNG